MIDKEVMLYDSIRYSGSRGDPLGRYIITTPWRKKRSVYYGREEEIE